MCRLQLPAHCLIWLACSECHAHGFADLILTLQPSHAKSARSFLGIRLFHPARLQVAHDIRVVWREDVIWLLLPALTVLLRPLLPPLDLSDTIWHGRIATRGYQERYRAVKGVI